MSNNPADSSSPNPEETPQVKPDAESSAPEPATNEVASSEASESSPKDAEPSSPVEGTEDVTASTAPAAAATPDASAEEPAPAAEVESTTAVDMPTGESPTSEATPEATVPPEPEAQADPASAEANATADTADMANAAAEASAPAAATETTTAPAGEAGSEATPGDPGDPEDGKPKRDFKIGSRRGDKKSRPRGPRPQTPGSKPAPPKAPTGPVPVPSKRGPLPDDWEKEVEEALGGKSVDELMSGGAEAAVAGPVAAPLDAESKVEAEVVRIHGDNVFMSLGGRNEGVASLRSFPPDAQPEPGQKMQVVVSSVSRDDGLYDVVVPGAAVEVSDWADLVEGAVVDARITGTNTGGLECKVNNIRGFIPASQVSLYRIEDFSEFVDTKMTCVVTEANQKKRNLVLSHRAILERERAAEREKLLESLAVGQIHEGVVRNIRDFGAFVDLGGVDGMIHISQMSWERVKHPSEVVSEGDKVRVRIEKMDPDSKKIGLSLRSLQEHPWKDAAEKFKVGSVVSGSVSRTANFGAFVKLAPGVEGLIHISELAHHRVSLVSSVVKEGDTVNVKVLSVDPDAQRMSLSIKQTIEQPQQEKSKPQEEEVEEPRRPTLPKHKGELKGGVDRPTGGEELGLKW